MEKGKDDGWKSWSHHIHGYIYPEDDDSGQPVVDDVQRESLEVIVDFLNRHR